MSSTGRNTDMSDGDVERYSRMVKEKKQDVMERKERMEEIIGKFADKKVAVIGDVMVDHYIMGTTTRISPEAPVPIIDYRGQKFGLGGAANVALNLGNLGAKVVLSGVYGNDRFGTWLGECLDREGIINACRIVPESLTIIKQRIVGNDRQICRIDSTEKPEAYGGITTVDFLDFKKTSAIFISDYGKGTVTDELMESVRKTDIPFYCDPKSPDLSKYSGAAGITPNLQEAERFRFGNVSEGIGTGTFLGALEALSIKSILMTGGAKGVSFWDAEMERPTEMAGHCVAIADACGAGDTAFAVYGLSKSCGASTEEAAFLANLAGSVVVQKPRVAPIGEGELVHALCNCNWRMFAYRMLD